MRPRTAATVATAAVLVATLASPALAGPYRRGELIAISGRVTDRGGSPLAGVTVLLEPSQQPFKLSKLFQRKRDREKINRLQIPTQTGADGSYAFEWQWDPFYNSFDLAIAVPVDSGGQKSYEILHRTDFTDRMKGGSPVVVALEVEDPSRLTAARRWSAPVAATPPRVRTEAAAEPEDAGSGAASDDERRILDEMGPPDQIDSHERLAGTETSWWYFEDGKVYHFLNDELSQVMHFDPIPASPDG